MLPETHKSLFERKFSYYFSWIKHARKPKLVTYIYAMQGKSDEAGSRYTAPHGTCQLVSFKSKFWLKSSEILCNQLVHINFGIIR